MSLRRLPSFALACVGFAVAVLPAGGCSDVALDKAVAITADQSGYIDLGIVNGETKLVPSATVRIKNISASTLSGFQLSAAFWRVGEDGQKDEMQTSHLVAKDLAPGATSEPIQIRAKFGYKLEGARADFFAHSLFVDFTIKVFGKINGRMFRIGEVTVDRKILPKDAVIPTT